MACLIILRGPMGSGKSAVGKSLRRKLVDSVELDLDLNANGEVVSLNEVLGKENVVEIRKSNSEQRELIP